MNTRQSMDWTASVGIHELLEIEDGWITLQNRYANFWNTLQQRTKWVRELYDLLLTSKEFVLPFANAHRISTTFKSEYKLCTRTFATGDGIKARQRASQIISLNLPSKPSTPFNLQSYTPFYIHNLLHNTQVDVGKNHRSDLGSRHHITFLWRASCSEDHSTNLPISTALLATAFVILLLVLYIL